MTIYNEVLKIPTLTEKNYEDFLRENLKSIFVHETEDYDYYYYFPSHFKITENCTFSKVFAQQG
jgi:hypothetical protein